MSIGLESILQAVGLKRRERLEGRRVTFRELVRSVADGTETNPDRIEALLDQSGKTDADLAAAVELYTKRKALRADLDAIPAKAKYAAELQAKIGAETTKFAAARERYEQAVRPMEFDLQETRRAMAQESVIRHELLTTAEPSLQSRLAEINAAISELNEGIADAERESGRMQRLLDDSLAGADAHSDSERKRQGNLRDRIAQRKQAVKEQRSEKARLEAESQELRKRAFEA